MVNLVKLEIEFKRSLSHGELGSINYEVLDWSVVDWCVATSLKIDNKTASHAIFILWTLSNDGSFPALHDRLSQSFHIGLVFEVSIVQRGELLDYSLLFDFAVEADSERWVGLTKFGYNSCEGKYFFSLEDTGIIDVLLTRFHL